MKNHIPSREEKRHGGMWVMNLAMTVENPKFIIPGGFYLALKKEGNGSDWTSELMWHPGSNEQLDSQTKFIRFTSYTQECWEKIKDNNPAWERYMKSTFKDYLHDEPMEGIFEGLANNKIQFIKSILPEGLIINTLHVGSTAIPGIKARAAITILIIVKSIETVRGLLDFILEKLKQEKSVLSINQKDEIRFDLYPTTHDVFKNVFRYTVYFIEPLNRQITMKRDFRNYMRAHHEEAKEYEKLKIALGEVYSKEVGKLKELYEANPEDKDKYEREEALVRHDYAKGKAEFVLSILKKCGHKNLYMAPEGHNPWEGDGCIRGNPNHIINQIYAMECDPSDILCGGWRIK